MLGALITMVRAFLKKMREDAVSAFAAQAAFFVILSFIPFIIFLFSLMTYLPIPEETLFLGLQEVIPGMFHSYIAPLFEEVLLNTTRALLSVSVVTALWSASRGVLVIMRGLNAVYGTLEGKGYFLTRLISLVYTLLFALVLAFTLFFLTWGNRMFFGKNGLFVNGGAGKLLVRGVRLAVCFLLLTVYFLALYHLVPHRRGKIKEELPGALLSAGGWFGFSFLYSIYIDYLSGVSVMYGSLTVIVLCMLWLYACMYIMFIGAELNVIVSQEPVKKAWGIFCLSLRNRKKRFRFRRRGNTLTAEKRQKR